MVDVLQAGFVEGEVCAAECNVTLRFVADGGICGGWVGQVQICRARAGGRVDVVEGIGGRGGGRGDGGC